MQGRWIDLMLAAVFAFLAVGCVSAAVSAAAAAESIDLSRFAPAAIATALIFGAFAVWTYRGAR